MGKTLYPSKRRELGMRAGAYPHLVQWEEVVGLVG